MSEQQESQAQSRRSSTGQRGSAPENGDDSSADAQRKLAEQVAARVYDMLCRDLRLERERQGSRLMGRRHLH
jgi:hypothetical protein